MNQYGQPAHFQPGQQQPPTWWLPQRRQIPAFWLVDQRAYRRLVGAEPEMYFLSVTLAANKTARTAVTVHPGFFLTTITGQVTAADPGDGLGSAQIMMFDPARRQAFMTKPVVSPLFLTVTGSGKNAPFMLRKPYRWNGGERSSIYLTIQNRAAANNVVSILFAGAIR
jgi:hypothetical protein